MSLEQFRVPGELEPGLLMKDDVEVLETMAMSSNFFQSLGKRTAAKSAHNQMRCFPQKYETHCRESGKEAKKRYAVAMHLIVTVCHI